MAFPNWSLPLLCALFMALSLVSLNTAGLKDHAKIRSVLGSPRWDVLCLQEVRWDEDWLRQFKSVCRDHVFASLGSVHSCGVVVVVRASTGLTPTLAHADTEGRALIVDCSGPVAFRLINIYAPNEIEEKLPFFQNIFNQVTDNTILIGDFNTALSKIDISDNNVYKNDRSRAILYEKIQKHDLTDIWRS